MISDATLAGILENALLEAIENRKDALVITPSKRIAGEVQGLRTALEILKESYDKASSPRRQET